MKTMHVLIAIITLSLRWAAQAEYILIDFGNNSSFRGTNVVSPDANGNYWNSVWSGAFYSGLTNTAGSASTVNFGFTTAGGTDYFNGPSGATQDPSATSYDSLSLGMLGVDEAVYDWYANSTFQLQNLNPAYTYNLTFFGSRKYVGATNTTTRYTVYTDNTFSTALTFVDLAVGDGGAEHNSNTVVTLSGLSPQSGNILYVGFTGNNGGNGYLNAMQIEIVPEPAAVTLLMAGGAVMTLLRRRKM